MRIACVGGGPAGLHFASLMKQRNRGHTVTVYERNPPGVTYGWGVVLWDETLKDLRGSDPLLARQVEEHAFRWTDQVLDRTGAEPVRAGGHGFSISRRHLLELLTRRARDVGVEVCFEHEVDALQAAAGADLVVAADGAGSRLRQRHAGALGTHVDVGRNRYLWLGSTKVFDAFTFGFAETSAGWIWMHAYGFDPATSTVVVECTPEAWTGLGLDRLDAADSIALLERMFARQLDGHRLIAGDEDGGPPGWLQFRTVTNRVWHAGHTVLAGDAAHTTHFSIGSGTSLALEDAIALADELGRNGELDAALHAYGRRRRAEIARAQAEARLSARFYEAVPRYSSLHPADMMSAMLNRRSPLVHRLPPARYGQLRRISRNVGALRWTRRVAAPAVEALLARRDGGKTSRG